VRVVVANQPSGVRRLLAALLLLAAVSGAGVPSIDPRDWFGRPVLAQDARRPAPPLPPGSTPDYRAIVREYGPAVVGITVAGLHRDAGGAMPPGMQDDPFFQFFRGLPGFQWRGPGSEQPFRGQGSGFIISGDGLILTNAHVVRDARAVTVKLSDRREFQARVLGTDNVTDVAVLRIDASGLPVVRLGDAEQLQVGDPVLAIGSPFGFEQTATQGIVSAMGRSLPGDSAVPFIQTDAAVNPGSSGGPLFDGTGAVVGINAQIYSRSGGYQGLAFAIPINVALKVKDQIVATGRASHARLGVIVQDLNPALAESFGLSRPDGALVVEVAPGSAAADAGLRAGDVVTRMGAEPVDRAADLSSRISLAAPGDTVRLSVLRDRSARDITVKLGRADDAAAVGPAADSTAAPSVQLGLRLRALTPEERVRARVQGGLLVESASGPSARAGLQVGDIVLAVNGTSISTVDQLRGLVEESPSHVALLVDRNGQRLFVAVKVK